MGAGTRVNLIWSAFQYPYQAAIHRIPLFLCSNPGPHFRYNSSRHLTLFPILFKKEERVRGMDQGKVHKQNYLVIGPWGQDTATTVLVCARMSNFGVNRKIFVIRCTWSNFEFKMTRNVPLRVVLNTAGAVISLIVVFTGHQPWKSWDHAAAPRSRPSTAQLTFARQSSAHFVAWAWGTHSSGCNHSSTTRCCSPTPPTDHKSAAKATFSHTLHRNWWIVVGRGWERRSDTRQCRSWEAQMAIDAVEAFNRGQKSWD